MTATAQRTPPPPTPRRRGIIARALTCIAAAATVAAVGLVHSAAAPASATTGYTWRNVEIVGGGFVPGIVFNQSEPDLIYARTDIGGAYRWDPATERWIPLLDHVGWDDWGHSGVVSIATDPVDPDRVYAAVGTYTNDWDPNNGAIKRSTDRGETWETTELPFKLGGNMPGRGMGERLAIDPNDNSVLYLAHPAATACGRAPTTARPGRKSPASPTPETTSPTPPTSADTWETTRASSGSSSTPPAPRPATSPKTSTSGWPTSRTPSTAPPTAARPGSASPDSPPASSRKKASSTTSTDCSTSPPATPAALTTDPTVKCGATTPRPAPGPTSPPPIPTASNTVSAA